ncbi:MAG: glycosyltransferase [Candidatus Coproplasma sp.]
MRIAEVSAFSQYSVGKIMRDIKKYIDEETDDVCEIFFARGDDKKEIGINKIGNDFLVKVNALLARIFDNDGFCLPAITNTLIKRLKAFNPDVIHLHCLHGYYLNAGRLFKYLQDNPQIKVVWTMHDTWAFTGHCCYFSKADCHRWETQCYKCPLKNEYPISRVFDNSKKNYLKKKSIFTSLSEDRVNIVTPSQWLGDLIDKSFLNKYKITTIHNGINTEIFNTEPSSEIIDLPEKKIILGVASVWDSRKGLDTFIELSKVISDDWCIVLIGKLTKAIDFPDNIIHIERTSNQSVLKKYYQSANVLLNPTLDDNYPTVNLEAQACGCKVLTFDAGGSKETDCGNLYLVDSTCVADIAKQIETISEYSLNQVNIQKVNKHTMAFTYFKVF